MAPAGVQPQLSRRGPLEHSLDDGGFMIRRAKATFRLLALFALAAAGLSQIENQPYFALSTTATFASNAKPVVSLSAWNVDVLEFRVYRVDDPVKFFQHIEDPHHFGSNTPRPPHERSLLEQV